MLDTCTMIWLANGTSLSPDAVAAVAESGLSGGVFVSTASAWEIGMLCRPRPGRSPALRCEPYAKTLFARFLAGPNIKEAPIVTSDRKIMAYAEAGFVRAIPC